MNAVIAHFLQALGWTLLQASWQGLLIGLMLWMGLRWLSKAPSALRYWLAMGALALNSTVVFISFLIAWNRIGEQTATLVTFTNTGYLAESHRIILPLAEAEKMGQISTWLSLLYLVGWCGMVIRLIGQTYQLRRISRAAYSLPDPAWIAHVKRLCSKMRINRQVRVRVTDIHPSPFTIGHFKPVIYVPASLFCALPPDQIEAIILHELAHIKRHDFLLALLQALAETFLFFHPCTWWMSRQIEAEREKACDELALGFTKPITLAEALLALSHQALTFRLALAMQAHRTRLFLRIQHIMEPQTVQPRLFQKWVLILLALMYIGSLAFLPAGRPLHPKEGSLPQVSPQMGYLVLNKPPLHEVSKRAFAQPGLKDTLPSDSSGIFSPMIDSIGSIAGQIDTLSFDSTMARTIKQVVAYLNSPQWQKQVTQWQQLAAKQARQLKQYLESDAWKKQQQLLQQQTEQLKAMWQSEAWKKQQEAIRQQAEQIRKYMESEAWRKQQQLIRQQLEQAQTQWQQKAHLYQQMLDSLYRNIYPIPDKH